MRILPILLLAGAAALSAQPRVTAAAHMGYYVSDLAKARAWYEDFLGFQEAFAAGNVVYVKINDTQFIKLLAEPVKNYGFLHDVAFRTGDARALAAALDAKGVKIASPVARDQAGDLAFDILDPYGFTIELVEYQPGSRTAATKGKFMPENRISAAIDHLGILIGDRAAAAKFYTDTFAFTSEGDGSKQRIGDGPDRFELGFERKPPTIDRFHVKDHICLSVPDVPKVAAMLQAKPAAKTYREIETHVLDNGKHVAELYDPDGNRVELMEPPKK